MSDWKYTDETGEVVTRTRPDGGVESCLATVPEAGTVILPADPVTVTERRIRDWEFRDRFTSAELDQIINAAYAGDSVARRVLMKVQTASDGVNLMSVDVIDGLDYLISIGILTAARKDAILS